MFAFLSTGTELSRFKRGKLPKIAVAVMLFIPLIYGALYLWAFQAPDKHLDQLPVALVNQDTGATNAGTAVHAGTDLASKLMAGMDVKWEQTDAATAAHGVDEGKYYFALTIPADFSAQAVSVGTDSPAQTLLDVRYNDSNNFLSTVLGKQAMAQVRDAVATQLGQQTSSTLLVGLHDAGDGLRSAALGSAQITGGIDSAKNGAGQLVVGMNDLANGSVTLKDGALALANGAGTLSNGVKDLSVGAATLNGGAQQLSVGTNSLAAGLNELRGGATTLTHGTAQLADGSAELSTKLTGAIPQAQKLSSGANDVSTNASTLAASAATTSAELEKLIATAQALPAGTPASALVASLQQLQSQAVTPLANGAAKLSTGATAVASGVGTLTSGVTEAATGASALSTGADTVNSGAMALSTAAGRAATGSADVASGATQVAAGAAKLSTGADSARDGASSLAAGAGTLSSGSGSLATGATKLADGGATLADGANKLSTGSHLLTDKLTEGGQTVPNDPATLLEKKSHVLANPVGVKSTWSNQSNSFGEGFAPFFIALATFVGALISWLLLRALPTRALAAGVSGIRSVLTGLLPALAIGLGQVLIMVAVLLWGLDMNPVYPVAMAGFIYLTTVAFLALQQMLIIVFGTAAGRVASLVLLMLQLSSSGGTYPVETTPAFFQALHPFMPATYVVNGLRALMTGGIDSRLWISVAFLAVMTVASVAISSFSAGRQRVFSIKRLHPELEM
ncbi:YhgE/Pip family protein [Arthrobacter cryoconiti]|uniref:YhgE/Pip family protein n=1 Tax=Arthrobacter cryoconiti TaxID=748907 RepID=A0ABV8R3V2_9MICC|nr:YhgE/Pip domain-containing protein [Arthrobacter cryoconiti]MCC9067149.1 YhgE/Pip domain-containing protein [Arthrobacter cryoconiti]